MDFNLQIILRKNYLTLGFLKRESVSHLPSPSWSHLNQYIKDMVQNLNYVVTCKRNFLQTVNQDLKKKVFLISSTVFTVVPRSDTLVHLFLSLPFALVSFSISVVYK